MKQDYRLLVLDLDGTLTNSKKEISPRNLRTLLRLQQSGVRLVLASGRPTYGIVPLAEQLQMKENNGYILSYNGGEIIDWSTGELLYKNLLPDNVLPILYQTATDNRQTILTYDNECILTENPNDPYVQKEAFLNKMQVRRVENFLQEIPLPLPKCLIVGEPEQLMKTEDRTEPSSAKTNQRIPFGTLFSGTRSFGHRQSTFDRRIIGKAGYHPRRSGSHGRRLQ